MSLNVEVLRGSFEAAKPIAGQVADYFYETLWSDFPQSKALFASADMPKQKKALINSLVFIIDNLENSDKLVSYLKQMGARHVPYGAQPEHYDWVGASLLKTLAHFFGDKWDKELEKAWTDAYGVIASTMIEGAKDYQPQGQGFALPDKTKSLIQQMVKEYVQGAIQSEIQTALEQELQSISPNDINLIVKKVA